MKEQNPILQVKDLTVSFNAFAGKVQAVRGVNFDLNKGETLCIVGESGSGKSVTQKAIRGILSKNAVIERGEILYDGMDLTKLTEKQFCQIRGKRIAMVFQDPLSALNPIMKVGKQITETLRIHQNLSHEEARKSAIELMGAVGIPEPEKRFNQYPFQFSGGMRQRIVIVIALACNPEILICDEPTTALDVTIQAQVLDMMNDLKERLGTSMILITHDLGVVAEMCDEVAVIYAGEVVEIGTARDIFKHMSHPYTIGLFESLPDLKSESKRLKLIPGLMPDPTDLPKGCKFAPRCSHCTAECETMAIPLTEITPGHFCRCLNLQQKEERV